MLASEHEKRYARNLTQLCCLTLRPVLSPSKFCPPSCWSLSRDVGCFPRTLAGFTCWLLSSDVRTRVKLLAYRVAYAHVQLARLQRWWRQRMQEMEACRRVMCRLWEQEVDRRVEAKVPCFMVCF